MVRVTQNQWLNDILSESQENLAEIERRYRCQQMKLFAVYAFISLVGIALGYLMLRGIF
jgi:hypothetical protein